MSFHNFIASIIQTYSPRLKINEDKISDLIIAFKNSCLNKWNKIINAATSHFLINIQILIKRVSFPTRNK